MVGREGRESDQQVIDERQADQRDTEREQVVESQEVFTTEASWSDASGDMLCLHTGDWRTERPIFDKGKCNACGFCYIFCPIQCISDDEDGIHYQADMEYCKGCGVCARRMTRRCVTRGSASSGTELNLLARAIPMASPRPT